MQDDFFYLDRPNKLDLPKWQSQSFISIYIYNSAKEIFQPTGTWGKLKLEYLLATLPRDGIQIFGEYASKISQALGLPLIFNDNIITEGNLNNLLNNYADDLARVLGEPGSEDVSIFIESTYPRK